MLKINICSLISCFSSGMHYPSVYYVYLYFPCWQTLFQQHDLLKFVALMKQLAPVESVFQKAESVMATWIVLMALMKCDAVRILHNLVQFLSFTSYHFKHIYLCLLRSWWLWTKWVSMWQQKVCDEDMALWFWWWLWRWIRWKELCHQPTWYILAIPSGIPSANFVISW